MATVARGRTPAQLFGLVFGVVYLLVGLLGFVNNPILGLFEVNALHNIAHLVIGALLVFGSTNPATAKTMNLIVGIVYLVLAVLGFANVLVVDLLKTNAADNWLHLVTALVAIYFGTAGATVRGRTATA